MRACAPRYHSVRFNKIERQMKNLSGRTPDGRATLFLKLDDNLAAMEVRKLLPWVQCTGRAGLSPV